MSLLTQYKPIIYQAYVSTSTSFSPISFSKQTIVSLLYGFSVSCTSSAVMYARFLLVTATVRLQNSLWLKLMTIFFSEEQRTPLKHLQVSTMSSSQLPEQIIFVLMMCRMSRLYLAVGAQQQRQILLKPTFFQSPCSQELSSPFLQVMDSLAYSRAAWLTCWWQKPSMSLSCRSSRWMPLLTDSELARLGQKIELIKVIFPSFWQSATALPSASTWACLSTTKLMTAGSSIYYNAFYIIRRAQGKLKISMDWQFIQFLKLKWWLQVFSRHQRILGHCWGGWQTRAKRSPGLIPLIQFQAKDCASRMLAVRRIIKWRKYLLLRCTSLRFQFRITPSSSLKSTLTICLFIDYYYIVKPAISLKKDPPTRPPFLHFLQLNSYQESPCD